MKTKNFTYSFTSFKTSEQVFQLLLHIEQWWSGLYGETIKGKAETVGDEFTFKAGGGAHYTKQKLIERVPNSKVVWLVTESKLNFLKDPSEWADTKIGFDITTEGDKTKITFTHDGLVPGIECYDVCSNAWVKYLEKLETKLK